VKERISVGNSITDVKAFLKLPFVKENSRHVFGKLTLTCVRSKHVTLSYTITSQTVINEEARMRRINCEICTLVHFRTLNYVHSRTLSIIVPRGTQSLFVCIM